MRNGYKIPLRDTRSQELYRPQTVSTETAEFSFRPLPTDRDINCYIVSDTHGQIDVPAEVGKFFGNNLDMLILGGDTT